MATEVGALAADGNMINRSVDMANQHRWQPIQIWASIGGLFIAFELYLYIRWAAAGNATENAFGGAVPPGWMVDTMWVHIVIGVVTLVGMLYWFLVRPWRASRIVTSDGLLMLACLTCFWQDLLGQFLPLPGALPDPLAQSRIWYNFIPGWAAPHGQLQSEATVFFFPMYAVCMFGFTSIADRSDASCPTALPQDLQGRTVPRGVPSTRSHRPRARSVLGPARAVHLSRRDPRADALLRPLLPVPHLRVRLLGTRVGHARLLSLLPQRPR